MPVLFFHGFVCSRLQCPPDGTIAASVGVRLIAVDRPGIGLSDRAPGRRLLDWGTDIKMLAEVLDLPRFALLGWSAGGPHALVCALLLPQQVVALGLASPMGLVCWQRGDTPDLEESPEYYVAGSLLSLGLGASLQSAAMASGTPASTAD